MFLNRSRVLIQFLRPSNFLSKPSSPLLNGPNHCLLTPTPKPPSFSSNSLTEKTSAPSSHSISLISAHGPSGVLVDVMLKDNAAREGKLSALSLPEWVVSKRQLCDIEMILSGGFSPLTGFMNKQEYESVVHTMRLPDGTLFPMPITMDVTEKKALDLKYGNVRSLGLKDEEGNIICILDIDDIYEPDKAVESSLVFGGDPEHPAIQYLMNQAGNWYIGGRLRGLQLPPHYDHLDIRMTPRETRNYFLSNEWNSIVAFQTRNPLHRAHFELTLRACQESNANLLLHPVVGMTKPGDIDHHTRVKCYRAIMNRYEKDKALLAAIPLAMRMGGPREAIFHSLIRQNYGATHFILGRDHAGPGANSFGKDFYGPYEARDAAMAHQNELKIKLLPFDQMVYVAKDKKYYPIDAVEKGTKVEKLSGTEVRKRLQTGEEIPDWFSFPEVVRILRSSHPSALHQGYCVFFTGLSGSGKSTIANALLDRLMSVDSRQVVLLDGDHVRQILSSELGFSTEHRNLNIKRIGYVASLCVKCGGCVIAAPIAPYEAARTFARHSVEQFGGFVEVFVSTPVSVCEVRDRKGLYAKARMGLLKQFTGIDDPYEVPRAAEVTIMEKMTVAEAVETIVETLKSRGYIPNTMGN